MIKKLCTSLAFIHISCTPLIIYSAPSENTPATCAIETNNNNTQNQTEAIEKNDTHTKWPPKTLGYHWLSMINFAWGAMHGFEGKPFHPIDHLLSMLYYNVSCETLYRFISLAQIEPSTPGIPQAATAHLLKYHAGLLTGYTICYFNR